MAENRRYYRAIRRPYRWLLGLIPAAIAILIVVLLPEHDRAPYLIAYPIVLLTAWFVGLGAATLCAVVTGVAVEYIIFRSSVVPHMLVARFSPLRVVFFIAASVLVAWLLRQVANLRQRTENEELRRQLERAQQYRQLAEERTAAELALRERDTRLQMALDGGHVGLWDSDLQTGRVTWSDEHYRVLGFEPGSVTPGIETMRGCIHPADRKAMDSLFEQTLAEARPFCCEYRVVWPDGSEHWIEAQAKYETNGNGHAIRMLGVLTDITHRKQAEAVLLRTEKLAAAGRFAASIAHEINNPLEAVANLLYLVSATDNIEVAHDHAQLAMSEIMRISRITQQTLKFHRQSESARSVRLSEIIEDVLNLFQSRVAVFRITLDRRYEDDPELECLAGDLRQVFANLVANAFDSMSEGGTFMVRMRRSRDWRNRDITGLRITVLDTGCGMDRHTRRHIYEPFFTTKKDLGTGLGLWVTSEIVERQRGDLRVWSSQVPGRSGTCFSLFLPLRHDSLGELSTVDDESTLQPT